MEKHDIEKHNYDALKLENQICFPLYAASKEIVRKYRPFLDEIGLTYTQYLVLLVLWEKNNINVKDLGEKLYLDSGTLTPVLKSLENKGYIDRRRSGIDERVLNVTLSKAGIELKQKALDIPYTISQSINLEMEEVGALYQILYKVLDNLGE